MGNIYLKYGNGAAASKELNQARTLGYSDPQLEITLLKAMQLEGKYQDILDKTASQKTPSKDTLLARGNAFLGLKQYLDASRSFNTVLATTPDSVEARVGLSHVALASGELQNAEMQINKAYDLDAENFQVWMLKGQLALMNNLPPQAEEAFKKASSLASYSPVAQFALVRALLAQGKTDAALDSIKLIESRFPNHLLAKYFRGLIAYMNDDKTKAKALLQDVVKVVSNHAESLLLLSRIYYEEKQMEQAKEYISAFLASHPNHIPALKLLSVITLSLQQSDEAIKSLSTAVNNAKDDGQALALLGSAYMESGNVAKGVELLEEAAQMNPSAASIRTQLAIGHLMVGETDVAVAELESAIKLQPDLIRADILLILAHIRSKKFDEAIAAATALSEKQANNPLPYNLIGTAYMGKNELDSARRNFEKAISLKPDFTPAIVNLARLDILNKDVEAAEKKFQQILSIDDSNVQALINLAALARQRDNPEKMLELLEKARSKNPSATAPRILLGQYYLAAGDNKKLLTVANEAFELSPTNPEVMLLLGQAQRLNNDLDKSAETLKKLTKLVPDSHNGIFELSLTQFQSGELKLARENLEEILKANPEHLGALIASVRLALQENEIDIANSYLQRLRKVDQKGQDSSLLEADILMAEGKIEDAIALYERSLKIDNTSAAVSSLANAYVKHGENDRAIQLIEDWLKEHPDDLKMETLLAAVHQNSSGNNKQAMAIFERILNKDPDSVIALNNLAWLNMDSNPALALKMAQRAFIQLPDRAEIADTLGWILIKQGKAEEGLAHIETARSRYPDSADIQYHYAAGLIFAGNIKRGTEELSKLLKEQQFFQSRKEAEELFNSLK